jgi:hypothetical protein
MSADPLRLFEDSGLPERVRADLCQAREAEAGYDTEGGLARFAAVVALAPVSGIVLHAAEAAAPHVTSGATAGASGAAGVNGASGAAAAGSAATAGTAVSSGAASLAGAATAGAAPVGGATVGAGSVAGGSAATSLLGALGAKLAVGVVAGGVAVGAMAFGARGDVQPAPVVAGLAGPAHHAVAASRAHADRALAADRPGEAASPQGDTGAPAPTAAPARAPAAAPGASATRALEEETEHLAALREAAASDPVRAVRMAEEGARRFPRGVFAQEREVIAIRALAASGRGAEARVRAAAFRARNPESPAAEGLQRLVGEASADPDPARP